MERINSLFFKKEKRNLASSKEFARD